MFRYMIGLMVTVLLTSVTALAILREGKTIPNFQTTLLDGRVAEVRMEKGILLVRLKDRKGNQTLKPKALILDFWATWCSPCHLASEWLSRLHLHYHKKGLVVLGISIDEDGRASVVPFVQKVKTPYLIALDPKAQVASQFKVESLPTIYIVDNKGIIAAAFEGLPNSQAQLERILRRWGIR